MVSVIIPVYNGEKFISRCIDSVLNQSFKDIEIIVINDGSKDNTKDILLNYQNQNENIKLINKENQGVSQARNDGINLAKGEYIAFIDSDDEIPNNYIKELYDAINNDVDMALCSVEYVNKDNIVKLDFQNKNYNIKEFIQSALIGDINPVSAFNVVWAKLFKSEILKENNLIFDSNFSYGEDTVFVLNYLMLIKNIITINKTKYSAIVRNDSLSQSFLTGDKLKSYKEINEKLENILNLLDIKDKKYYSKYCVDVFFARTREVLSLAPSRKEMLNSLNTLLKSNLVDKQKIKLARKNGKGMALLAFIVKTKNGFLYWIWMIIAGKLRW